MLLFDYCRRKVVELSTKMLNTQAPADDIEAKESDIQFVLKHGIDLIKKMTVRSKHNDNCHHVWVSMSHLTGNNKENLVEKCFKEMIKKHADLIPFPISLSSFKDVNDSEAEDSDKDENEDDK
eukprot:684365_1